GGRGGECKRGSGSFCGGDNTEGRVVNVSGDFVGGDAVEVVLTYGGFCGGTGGDDGGEGVGR
ncbi:hypothetical protein A2U01_0101918, partial [Trifolium medium]|nr:hypothetical protein [Trifolium medium]